MAIISGQAITTGRKRLTPMLVTTANDANEIPNAMSPISITGLRPQRSLRAPQKPLEKTQIVADETKGSDACNSERPSLRASDGNIANITDWPAPRHIRLKNRIVNARRRSPGVVTRAKASGLACGASARCDGSFSIISLTGRESSAKRRARQAPI